MATDRPSCLAFAYGWQGRGHTVPIVPALAAVIDACPGGAETSPVFASRKTAGAMSGWSDMAHDFCAEAGVIFTLHDRRRMFRTGLSRVGVSDDIAELALGHGRSNLEANYNRDEAAEALRVAFETRGRYVTAAVSPKPDVFLQNKPATRKFLRLRNGRYLPFVESAGMRSRFPALTVAPV